MALSARGWDADIAIDLGTANTLVIEREAGVVFDQPSICCFDYGDAAAPRFVAAGSAAKDMIGREVKRLRIVRPLRDGVLNDVDATRELLRFATASVRSRWGLRRPRPLIGCPTDATQAERRALSKAAVDAGLAEPVLIPEPLLSAVGAGLDIDEPRGRMIVDCGAGTSDIAVISMGGICASRSVRGGGEGVDAALRQHLHLRCHFQIGQATAERLKAELSRAIVTGSPAVLSIRGLDLTRGLPTTMEISVAELRPVLERFATQVASAARKCLAQTPPEISKDILEDGITLTGGCADLGLLADRITEATTLRATAAAMPLRTVAEGLQTLLSAGRSRHSGWRWLRAG